MPSKNQISSASLVVFNPLVVINPQAFHPTQVVKLEWAFISCKTILKRFAPEYIYKALLQFIKVLGSSLKENPWLYIFGRERFLNNAQQKMI